jgi:hypothetical protein
VVPFHELVDSQRDAEQRGRGDRVEPVVVGSEHDGGERDHGVREHEVAPAALRREQHGPGDHQRPPEMQ